MAWFTSRHLLAGWLPVHRDQLRAQRSVTSMGKLYFLLLSFTAHMPLLMATSTFELGRRCWSSPHQCLSLYLTGRLIREAVWIRKSSNINRDEGSDRLRHVWDSILTDVWNRKSVLLKAADCRANHCLFCFRCVIQSNLPKWIPLKWITRLKGCHLSDLICTQCKV